MAKLGSLESIRAMFDGGKKKCPKCSAALTIEQTEFFETEICEKCLEHVHVRDISTCCRNPDLHLVKLITSSNTIQVRKQCKSCGKVEANSVGGVPQREKDKLPLVDESLRKSREESVSGHYKKFHATISDKRNLKFIAERNQSKEVWMKQYNSYLDSPEWKSKRNSVLKRDVYLCQCCLDAYATQVHHKSYEFVDLKGSEPAFDLVAICVPCHEKIEEMKKARKQAN